MKDAKLPLGFRDNCAHLLIPLNQCAAASQRHLSRARSATVSPEPLFAPFWFHLRLSSPLLASKSSKLVPQMAPKPQKVTPRTLIFIKKQWKT